MLDTDEDLQEYLNALDRNLQEMYDMSVTLQPDNGEVEGKIANKDAMLSIVHVAFRVYTHARSYTDDIERYLQEQDME